MSNPEERVKELQRQLETVKAEVGRVVVGQEGLIHRLLIGMIAGGHVLVEGVPGLAKTLTVRSLSQCIDIAFSRIQFTPDMLPGDVIGTQIYNPSSGEFSVKKGPIFGHLVLADEINRAPAKVQSALLEAMQERQVTLGDQTFGLNEPFMVMATQNPIEQEGTYPLPEAQLDRFMLKVVVGHLSKDEELKVIDRMAGAGLEPVSSAVISPEDIIAARQTARELMFNDKVKRYVVDLVFATRNPRAAGLGQLTNLIENGASARASINLVKAAKAHALLNGRSYVTPHDVKSIALDVLRHRVLLTYEAEAEGQTPDSVVTTILENVEVP